MNAERHSRKCQACHHPDLADIHRDFMSSVSCLQLDQKYGLASGCARRHAIATGWYEERQQNSVATLDRYIAEGISTGKVDRVRVTGANVIRALELKAKLSGEMREPPTDTQTDSGKGSSR